MAIKSDTLVMGAVILIAVIMLGKGEAPAPVVPNGPGIDICALVESEVSFTGQTMFLAGTALPHEGVRVLKVNGDGTIKDKGNISMDSGTTDTSPGKPYKLYFGLQGSGSYYTQPVDYTAPCKDATDDKVGVLCTIDTTPTITVFDEYGNVMTVGSNEQAIGSGESVDVGVQIKVSADECFGNPYATKKNAICFGYNSTIYDLVSIDAPSIATPYLVATDSTIDLGIHTVISCYELPLLKDKEKVNLDITIDVASGQDPSSDFHNISIAINDMAFDLDADTLDEIWGFEDESNNELGDTSITLDQIHTS